MNVLSMKRLGEAITAAAQPGDQRSSHAPAEISLGGRTFSITFISTTCYQGRFCLILTGEQSTTPTVEAWRLSTAISDAARSIDPSKPVAMRVAGEFYGLTAVTADGGRLVLTGEPLPEAWAGVTVRQD